MCPERPFLSPRHSLSVAEGHTGSRSWSRDRSSSSFDILNRTELQKTVATIKKIKVSAVDANSRNELVKWREVYLSPAWLDFTNSPRPTCRGRRTYQRMRTSYHRRGCTLDFTNVHINEAARDSDTDISMLLRGCQRTPEGSEELHFLICCSLALG